MKRIIIYGIIVALALGGYLYFRSLRTSPQYSLAQAVKSSQLHDVEDFERYVDVGSVAENLIDQVATQSSALGIALPRGFMMQEALMLMKPQLASVARNEVRHYVRTGSLNMDAGAGVQRLVKLSLAGVASKVVSADSKFKQVKYVNEQAGEARVGIEFTQPKLDTTLVLELKMLDRGEYWQVTEITNTAELIRQVNRLEQKQLLNGNR